MTSASHFCSASASNSATYRPLILSFNNNIHYINAWNASSFICNRRSKNVRILAAASSSSSTAWAGCDDDGAMMTTGTVDLYEVLGVERGASSQEIRRSYRWLQKKCHPDIAGPDVGHAMSVLLNHAYTTLSDPDERAVYDQSRVEWGDLEGYTGAPLYSKWVGSCRPRAGEGEAVFVDESRCVGCLKCALIAPHTFAIETKFGRARAIGQRADPQHLVQDAIQSCPVDCISWVDKGELAVFEFAMSKIPRVPVGIEVHSSGGVRSADVFKEAERLIQKLRSKDVEKSRSSRSGGRETVAQRRARVAAMDEIQARAGRWWYNYLIGKSSEEQETASSFRRKAHAGAIVASGFYSTPTSQGSSRVHSSAFNGHEFGYIFEASKRFWSSSKSCTASSNEKEKDSEYWVPPSITHSESAIMQGKMYGNYKSSSSNNTSAADVGIVEAVKSMSSLDAPRLASTNAGWAKELMTAMPMWMSGVAVWFVGLTADHTSGMLALSDYEIGLGPIPSEWMQSMEMHIVLTAIVWYLFGAILCGTLVFMGALFQQADE